MIKQFNKRLKKNKKVVILAITLLILANLASPTQAKETDLTNVNSVIKAQKPDIITAGITAYQEKQEQAKQIQLAKKQAIYPKYKPGSGELYTVATAYTSSKAETDATPCITADGYNVCQAGEENVIATNFLPFGTKVKIPDLYGDKEFVVHDRMNRRYSNRIDIWMKDRSDAIEFGKQQVKIVVVE
ncbi:MAG: hypothetical protein ACOZBH_00205 [Patescibacteria group bacterium]